MAALTPESAQAAAQSGIGPGDPLWHVLERMDALAEKAPPSPAPCLTPDGEKEVARRVAAEVRAALPPLGRSLATRNGALVALAVLLAAAGGYGAGRAEQRARAVQVRDDLALALGDAEGWLRIVRWNPDAPRTVVEGGRRSGRRVGTMAVWLERPAPAR